MAKPENPAEAPVNARPPRPVQRVRLELPPGAQRSSLELAEGERLGDERASVEHSHIVGGDSAGRETAGGDAAGGDIAGGEIAGHHIPGHHIPGHHIPGHHIPGHHIASDAERSDTTRDLEVPEMLADSDLCDEVDDAPRLYIEEVAAEEAGVEELAFIEAEAFEAERHETERHETERHEVEGDSLEGARHPSVAPRPGLAWGRPGSGSLPYDVPLATLERPSMSRIELTPSPVPRVALAPATGAVDISLVPGPNAVGSRNLPTLAAQHLVGRKPRRHAPAVTVPPPARASREPGAAFALARGVRSSKGEIVLGLAIGLGVSLLLAGLGQAYLRSDVVADQEGAELESVTLSARPEGARPERPGAAPEGVTSATSPGAASGEFARSGSAPAAPEIEDAARAHPATTFDAARNDDRSAALAYAAAARPERAAASRAPMPRSTTSPRAARGRASISAEAPPRATLSRATPARARGWGATHPDLPGEVRSLAPAPAPSSSAAPPDRAAAPSSPLTPAQSAGLGLDLPL